ncbi:MAG: XRE family transcriptional regulator [Rhodospirillaceae bacterium]|nr:MAG: XRE family transcriptional regulator [Rhodospirillaceae bacterium]
MHSSVSDVCRRIGMNRQQFNKYLSGESLPSAHNLRRIALYFDVASDELFLPAAEFNTRHGGRIARPDPQKGDAFSRIMAQAFPGDLRRLRPLLGFYHSYFLVPHSPKSIVRALLCLEENDGRVYSKDIERSSIGTSIRQRGYLSKYDGIVSYLGNCIFILEFESLTADTLTETILFPSYRKRLDILTGMTLGVTSRVHRQPFSSLIAWKYLGQNIDMRRALSQCGSLAESDRSIDPNIRAFLLSGDQPTSMSFDPRDH